MAAFSARILKKSESIGWILALIPAWAFVAYLAYQTRDLPCAWDGSEYLLKSQDIYHNVISGNWSSLYLERDWKGIALPNLGALFFLVLGDHARRVMYLSSLLFLSVLGFQLHAFFRQRLSARKAFLATLFLMSSSWILKRSPLYMLELPFAACFIAGLRWVWHPDFAKSKSVSLYAGFWLAASLCFRPFEGPLLLLCLMGPFRRRGAWQYFAAPFLLTLVWFLPSARATWGWAVESGFLSPFTHSNSPALQGATSPLFGFASDLWDSYHLLWLAILISGAILLSRKRESVGAWIGLLPLVFIHPLIGALSQNSDWRYYIVSAIAAFAAALGIVLSSGRLGSLLVAILTVLNLYNIASIVYPKPVVPRLHGDYSVSLWPVLKKNLDQTRPASVLVWPLPGGQRVAESYFMNLAIRAKEARLPWEFSNYRDPGLVSYGSILLGPIPKGASMTDLFQKYAISDQEWRVVGVFSELPEYPEPELFALLKRKGTLIQ